MKRREFITLLGGAAAAWPLAAQAQQSSPALIGFFNAAAATVLKQEIDVFRDGLRNLGHIEGRNVRFEYRFADGYLDRLPTLAAELVRLNPNVIVSSPVQPIWRSPRPRARFRS
jgi:putative tryptophan/tyrosine transport system substrate-binding protein